MANTTINDVYQPLPDEQVTLSMQIGQGQQSKTFVLLGNNKILETMESTFSIELTQFKKPLRGAVLRVRCVIEDTQRSGKSFVQFKLSDGTTEFDSQLPDNEIVPVGGVIVYTYRILFT